MTHQEPSAPAIVMFMVDQLSARWLEAAMAGVVDVPNFRKLAARGGTFTNAITSNPVCCPARATIATGLSTTSHGVLENGYVLDPALPTFMQQMQTAGWKTGAFGKLHCHPHYMGLHPDYKPYGFDDTDITEDPRGGDYLDWVLAEHPEHLDAVLGTIWATPIPEFSDYGPEHLDLVPRILAAQKKTDWTRGGRHPLADEWAYPLPFPEEIGQTCWITQRGLDFVRAMPADQPFFAQFSYVQPHGPKNVPERFLERVDEGRIPRPAPAAWRNDPLSPACFEKRPGKRGQDPEQLRWGRKVYFADIAHLDEQLGKVTAALETAGRLENTTILFLADHGDMLGDHDMHGKEEIHFDACIRVPMMIAGPNVSAAGATCDAMVQLEDVCPTMLDISGVAMPTYPTLGPNAQAQEGYPTLPGRSLLNLCGEQVPPDWRTSAYCGSYNAIWSADPHDWARTIRTDRWRYTFYPGGAQTMFDLSADRDEQTNLAGDAAWASQRETLRAALMELMILQDYPRTRRQLFALGVH